MTPDEEREFMLRAQQEAEDSMKMLALCILLVFFCIAAMLAYVAFIR